MRNIEFCGYVGETELTDIRDDILKNEGENETVDKLAAKRKELRGVEGFTSCFDFIYLTILVPSEKALDIYREKVCQTKTDAMKININFFKCGENKVEFDNLKKEIENEQLVILYDVEEYLQRKEWEYEQNIHFKCNEKFFDILREYTMYNTTISLIKSGGVRQFILTGAPGTGKTYMAKKIARDLGEICEFVQFHPSYDYGDFVEGLRPVEVNNQVTFKKIDGIFKKFCRDVVLANEKSPEKLNFFIIDEINRADLSKVLGELMFGLECDKRGEENKFKTQYSNLSTYDFEKNCEMEMDCFKDGFYIPENIVIIGTMNDIDRSVESFDFALRRRFQWMEVEATSDLLEDAFTNVMDSYGFSKNEVKIEELITRISSLNSVIERDGAQFGLNKHYFISQGYFTNLKDYKDVDEICKYVWEYRIKNILEEYVRGEDPGEVIEFINSAKKVFCPKQIGTEDMTNVE